MNMQLYLDKIVLLFKGELEGNLSGIYLHGSLAMGCFHPQRSDIDFIVVIRESLTAENKKRIAKLVLELDDEMPNERGMEFSVILESHLNAFVYPTPCEMHYSDFHKERYQSDENYVCGGYEDNDFAAQLVVAYYRGKTLYGKSLAELYEPIDRKYYLASIYYDIKDASDDIMDQPMYITLNLCRVLFYLRDGNISSKKEGGEWGVKALPNEYQDLVRKCLDEYTGVTGKQEFDPELLAAFADNMLREIKQLI
ncbi:aminoglycoside adenylyltransferase domain-containing protein [Bacillus sp. FJAT-28004]|uniref:aminoglycoside adenylyltransferase domain-containing protein n=1 Tax=Bacillus sp. FJAT-28004 TaxID=1679165 RepID=UPI0006B69851|nr:aminoglycoside adenylyltransferase domain-containing protein [Bacillus sp. FJAT-28004]